MLLSLVLKLENAASITTVIIDACAFRPCNCIVIPLTNCSIRLILLLCDVTLDDCVEDCRELLYLLEYDVQCWLNNVSNNRSGI